MNKLGNFCNPFKWLKVLFLLPLLFSRFKNGQNRFVVTIIGFRIYFLSYSATDMGGEGRRSLVNIRISLKDSNDNPPVFESKEYSANIDENEAAFQPELIVKATDLDATSKLRYAIVEGNLNDLFKIDPKTGEVSVSSEKGLRLDNIPTDQINLSVEVTDGENTDYTTVSVSVKDVNDRSVFFLTCFNVFTLS